MNVLFVAREDIFLKRGGDSIQLEKTRESLSKMGVNVKIGTVESNDAEWADIIHIFNLQTPEVALSALMIAKKHNKKVAISTIWWDLDHARLAEQLGKLGISPNLFSQVFVYPLNFLYRIANKEKFSMISHLLRSADILLPNSLEEMSIIKHEFGENLANFHIVHNAVDSGVFNWSEKQRKGVICCARIEPTKNQVNLINAIPNNCHFTLVGKFNAPSRYALNVRQLMKDKGFELIEANLSQIELSTVISEHYVHAMPSFRESPGLSSLEALSLGLNVLISDKKFCPTTTYFDKIIGVNAFTCNPYSVKSIKKGLDLALSHKLSTVPPNGLSCLKHWDDVALETLQAYNALR